MNMHHYVSGLERDLFKTLFIYKFSLEAYDPITVLIVSRTRMYNDIGVAISRNLRELYGLTS